MFALEPTQQDKHFSTPRMVRMGANPVKAARTAEGTLVSSVNFSEFSVLACCANYLFLFFFTVFQFTLSVYCCCTKNEFQIERITNKETKKAGIYIM